MYSTAKIRDAQMTRRDQYVEKGNQGSMKEKIKYRNKLYSLGIDEQWDQ